MGLTCPPRSWETLSSVTTMAIHIHQCLPVCQSECLSICQVAYDVGVRHMAVGGLQQMREAVPLLPDDIHWGLTGTVSDKNAKRIPMVTDLE